MNELKEDWEIIQGFANLVAKNRYGMLGQILGIPESKLPYKKEKLETAFEKYMLLCGVDYYKTNNSELKKKLDLLESTYLLLAGFWPDDEIIFPDIVCADIPAEEQLTLFVEKRKQKKFQAIIEKWLKASELKLKTYGQKVIEIRNTAKKLAS